jgi:hypothetical protein
MCVSPRTFIIFSIIQKVSSLCKGYHPQLTEPTGEVVKEQEGVGQYRDRSLRSR